MPALFTPFDEQGMVDTVGLARQVERLLTAGVHGFFVAGTTGEGLLLTEAERREVLEIVVQTNAARGAVIAHVGAVDTAQSARLAKHAYQVGVDGLASLPPFTYGRGKAGLESHFRVLADVCPLPLLLYHIPGLIAMELTPEDITCLLPIPSFHGMKFSSADLYLEHRFTGLKSGFRVLHGCDETLLQGLMLGAVGAVGLTYNLLPKLAVDIYSSFQNGNLSQAHAHQRRLTLFIDLLYEVGSSYFLPAGKALLRYCGIWTGPPRLPVPPLSQAAFDELLKRLDQQGYLQDLAY